MCGGTDLAAPQTNRFAQKRVGLPAGVMAAARYLSEVSRLGREVALYRQLRPHSRFDLSRRGFDRIV